MKRESNKDLLNKNTESQIHLVGHHLKHRTMWRAKLALKDKTHAKNYVKLYPLIMFSDAQKLCCITLPFPDVALYVVECQISLTMSS